MTEDEIKRVVQAVLTDQAEQHFHNLDDIVLKSIATILTSFGIEDDDRMELKADFMHLRRWRKSVEQAQGYTFKIVITAIVSGIIGAVWLGFKSMLGK